MFIHVSKMNKPYSVMLSVSMLGVMTTAVSIVCYCPHGLVRQYYHKEE